MSYVVTSRTSWYLALAVLVVGVVLLSTRSSVVTQALVGLQEGVTFALMSSAERAYAYGSRHFDAARASDYDIDRADYFFDQAYKIDPQLPNLQHQRARVAFLQGDFLLALARIDAEIRDNPELSPSSHYVRGLILGYMGRFEEAAESYERYLGSDPNNWAAINDYAWVLLKAERFEEAAIAAERGLSYLADNPWLLNTRATALYELGRYAEALAAIEQALGSVESVTEERWLTAYPGNDPKTASAGIETLRNAIVQNAERIVLRASE